MRYAGQEGGKSLHLPFNFAVNLKLFLKSKVFINKPINDRDNSTSSERYENIFYGYVKISEVNMRERTDT